LTKLTELRLFVEQVILLSCNFFDSWKFLTSLTLSGITFTTNAFPFVPKLQKLLVIHCGFCNLNLTSILNGVAPYLKIFIWDDNDVFGIEDFQIPRLKYLEEFTYLSSTNEEKLLHKFMNQIIYSAKSMRKMVLRVRGAICLRAETLVLFQNLEILDYRLQDSKYDALPLVN
jgi:hypothetical protein